tara:strand:+ start:4687 stop:5097 length:411 start_codon:yes stop_codon:yes gene_type:complete
MSENNNKNQIVMSELKANAMMECNDWVERCKKLIKSADEQISQLAENRLALNECRITWLERAAGVMQVDVRRDISDDQLDVFWSDTEGNILRDPDTEEPLQKIELVSDIMALTVPSDKALEVIKGQAEEPEPENES